MHNRVRELPGNSFGRYIHRAVDDTIGLHQPHDRRVVRIWNKRHRDVRGNINGRVLVNAIRVVGHVDDDVRRHDIC